MTISGVTDDEIRRIIERFVAAAGSPALLEPGEELIPLTGGNLVCETRGGRLIVQAWDEHRNLWRRVTGIAAEQRGRLELRVERFGGKRGAVLLLDLARPAAQDWNRRGARLVFREEFRRMLQRTFGGWRVAELSSEPDLEHSLSPAYPRALMRQGSCGWAAIAAPPDAGDAGVLSFGLIWLDYLRRRESRLTIQGLAVFTPAKQTPPVAWRIRCLDPGAARFDLFSYDGDSVAVRVDLNDCGNLDTVVEPCRRPMYDPVFAAALAAAGDVDQVLRNDGEISFRIGGLEIARTCGEGIVFGLEERQALEERNLPEACRLVREVTAMRHGGPLQRLSPELWLESQVRRELERIDPTLFPAPVYGQVPAFTAGDRGVLDLLAVDRTGRLAVVELKASADLHLPLQALDYWLRVRWHLERGEFTPRGYFPGVALSAAPPRLLLVSPALEFHPTTETLLGYFSPGIDVERIGLGLEWRKRVQVLFRRNGAACA
jgi:hypothetical protein